MFNKCPPDPLPDEELKVAIVKQCEENNLEGTAHFLSKVQQLYDMMDLSDGVMLLGKYNITQINMRFSGFILSRKLSFHILIAKPLFTPSTRGFLWRQNYGN